MAKVPDARLFFRANDHCLIRSPLLMDWGNVVTAFLVAEGPLADQRPTAITSFSRDAKGSRNKLID